MQTKVESLDLDKYYETLKNRYFGWVKYLFYKNFEIVVNKDVFINSCTNKARIPYSSFTTDMYMINMVEILKEKVNLKRPMREIVDEVQIARKLWKHQQEEGIKNNQPYEPIGDFVSEDRDEKIVKKIVKYSVVVFFKLFVLDAEMKKLKPALVKNDADKGGKADRIIKSFQWYEKINAENHTASLYNWLIAEGLILKNETSLPAFKAVFRGIKIEHPIIWQGELGDLIYLLDELAKCFLVLPENIETIIESKKLDTKDKKAVSNWLNPKLHMCFFDSKGNLFSKEAIKHAKNFYQNKKVGIKKPGKGLVIDEFITLLKNK